MPLPRRILVSAATLCCSLCPSLALAQESASEPVDVVVTGTRVRTAAFDSATDVEVITGERVHPAGGKSFRESLVGVTGVRLNARGEDPTFSGIEVRGLSTNATSGANALILLDGIPQRRLSFGGPYMGALPYDAVSRIELVKGPLSSQYGRGSLAGAIQLFTHPGSETFGARARMLHELVTNTQRGSLSVYGPLPLEDTTFSVTGSGTVSNGWQPRSNARHGDVYVHVSSYLTLCDHVRLTVGYYDAEEQSVSPVLIDEDGDRLRGIDRDANLAVPDQNALDIAETRLGINYTHDFSPTMQLGVTVARWAADTGWKMGRPSDAPGSGTVVTRPARDLDWEESSWLTEIQLQESYQLSEDIAGVVTGGVSGEILRWDSTVQNISAGGSTFAEGIPIDLVNMDEPPRSAWVRGAATTRETDELDRGVFISDTTTFYDRVTVQGGLRYDQYRRSQRNLSTGDDSSVSDSALSPAAGLVLHLLGGARKELGLNLYGSWGRGFSPVFRAVSNAEIVEVDPETSESVEAGVKFQAWRGLLSATVAAYQLDRKDVVGWNPDSLTQENIGDWQIRGVEVSVRGRPVRPLSLFAGATLRTTSIERDDANPQNEGNRIPFVSDIMTTLGASYAPDAGLGGDVGLRTLDGSFADDANRIHLPGAWLLDASVSYRWREMTVTGFTKNLLDADYYSAVFQGVRNGAAFAGTPRTYGAALTMAY